MKELTSAEHKALVSLLGTSFPSSSEDDAFSFIDSYNDGVCVLQKDAVGNIYMTPHTGQGPTVMIAAHCDEIGLQVIHIDDNGFIRFRPVGGVDIKSTAGRQVIIFSASGRIPGVICKVPIHVEMKETTETPLNFSNLWIDIGCSSKEEALSLVSIGDMIGFTPNFIYMGGNRLASKALDNKLGVFIAATAVKRISNFTGAANNVTTVFTVQEEVGCKGAAIAAQTLHPSWGICIDVGVATDCPGIQIEKYGNFVLGHGPGLCFCTDSSKKLTDKAADILTQECIPFQKTTGLSASGGTDTMRMQIAGEGVPCILLSIPLRSMHTPSEVCDLRDISAAIDAVVCLVRRMEL